MTEFNLLNVVSCWQLRRAVCAEICSNTGRERKKERKLSCSFVYFRNSTPSQLGQALFFPPSLTRSKASFCARKSLHARPAGMTRRLCLPACSVGTPPPCFLTSVSLFFRVGLHHFSGEVAAGKLRSDSGHLCRCGSCGGILFFIFRTTLKVVLACLICISCISAKVCPLLVEILWWKTSSVLSLMQTWLYVSSLNAHG